MKANQVDGLTAQLAKAAQADDSARMVAILGKLEKLGEAATPAAPAVIGLLARNDYSIGEQGRAALGAMIPEIVASELMQALEDDRRAGAIEYLDELHRATAANSYQEPPIVPALKEVAVPVLVSLIGRGVERQALVPVLGMLGSHDDDAFDTLVELLGDDDKDVRLAVPLGLAYCGDRAVPHLEKLLAKDGETGRVAIQGKGTCINAVCGALLDIETKKAMRALKKAAASGKYGRVPKDLQYLLWERLHKAETKAKIAELEAKRLAKLAAPKPAKKPAAKKPAAKKPAAKKSKRR